MKKLFSKIKRFWYINRKSIRVVKFATITAGYYCLEGITEVDLSPLYIVTGFYFINQIKK